LNGNAHVRLVGPVLLTLRAGVIVNSAIGSPDNPAWLTLRVAAGGVTLNGGAALHGLVIAPSGTVSINGTARLVGRIAADALQLNGRASVEELAP
jgi:hypothetical protein